MLIVAEFDLENGCEKLCLSKHMRCAIECCENCGLIALLGLRQLPCNLCVNNLETEAGAGKHTLASRLWV